MSEPSAKPGNGGASQRLLTQTAEDRGTVAPRPPRTFLTAPSFSAGRDKTMAGPPPAGPRPADPFESRQPTRPRRAGRLAHLRLAGRDKTNVCPSPTGLCWPASGGTMRNRCMGQSRNICPCGDLKPPPVPIWRSDRPSPDGGHRTAIPGPKRIRSQTRAPTSPRYRSPPR